MKSIKRSTIAESAESFASASTFAELAADMNRSVRVGGDIQHSGGNGTSDAYATPVCRDTPVPSCARRLFGVHRELAELSEAYRQWTPPQSKLTNQQSLPRQSFDPSVPNTSVLNSALEASPHYPVAGPGTASLEHVVHRFGHSSFVQLNKKEKTSQRTPDPSVLSDASTASPQYSFIGPRTAESRHVELMRPGAAGPTRSEQGSCVSMPTEHCLTPAKTKESSRCGEDAAACTKQVLCTDSNTDGSGGT